MNKKIIIWTLLLISSVSSATTHNLVHNLKDHHRTKRESFINLEEVPDIMHGLANTMRRGFNNVVHQGNSLRQRMLGLGSNFMKSAHKKTHLALGNPFCHLLQRLVHSTMQIKMVELQTHMVLHMLLNTYLHLLIKNPSQPPQVAPAYQIGDSSGTLDINFDDCDCHFGNSDSFKPLPTTGFNANIDTYGKPAGNPIVVASKPTVITSSFPSPPSPSYSGSSIPVSSTFISSSNPSSSFITSSSPSSSFISSSNPSSSFISSSNPSSSFISSSNPSSSFSSSSIPSSSSSFSSFSSSIGTQPTVTYTKPIVQTFSSSYKPQPAVPTFNKPPIVSQSSSLPVITSSTHNTGGPIISQTSGTFSFPAGSSYTVSGTGSSIPSTPISFSQQSIGSSSFSTAPVNSFPSPSSSFSSFPSSNEILHTTSPLGSSSSISGFNSITNTFSSNNVPQIQVTNDISTDPIYTPSVHVDSSPAPQSVNEIDHHDQSEEKKKFINLDEDVLRRVLSNTLYYKDLTSFKKKYHKNRKIHKKKFSVRR
ncbi:unnamed protein product [Lepeophtheirus salmonis]|uniref:(salmon louse) hypothetical protein n=1 Tax=Lepeophtheirus salmonis TaxID=72036 RepID=A0A7R8CQP5_LEPSM|nr:unnamed protein product [Lepeophtheirus salmonis]CAF2897699.1 unnamed protein product [Lepeophtheirus salmonis]